ncbi:MAG: NAD-binding protein [Methylobacter tundripaludum]|nr:NAD-binding protein [Methylobacter tundripaludum]
MLTRLIVYLAYFLKASKRYQRTKLFFYDLLENAGSPLKSYFDVFMICLVMLSVFLLIYEVDHKLGESEVLFERCVISLFIAEYLLRGWLYSDNHKIILEHYEKAEYLNVPFRLGKVAGIILAKKIKYIFTPLALIDLLAILPTYRPLRVMRIFLLFRLFKLFRYFNSIKVFARILVSRRFELVTLGIFLGFLVFIGSTAIYLFENPANGGQVKNLFEGFYWAVVTVATVGYGDISPQTTGGRIIAMVLILVGLGVLSFLVSIIVTAFNEEMDELRENSTYAALNRFDDFIIICGFGRVGQHIARQLEKDQLNFVIIDPKEANVLKAKRLGYLVIHEDASKNGVIQNAGINNGATAVICTTGDDVINVYITLTSRHLNPGIKIISRANNQDNVKKLYQAGASNVIQPFEIAGMVVAEYIGQPVAFEAILGIIREESHIIMETLCVHPGSFIERMSIAEIDFEKRKLMLLGIISANPVHQKHKNSYPIKNQHFYFNPESFFVLRDGDLLVVIGREYSIDYFRDQIEKSRLKRGRKR